VLADERDPHTRLAASVTRGAESRVAALSRALPAWKGGVAAWVRGTNSFRLPESQRAHLPEMRNPNDVFYSEVLLRLMLSAFGCELLVGKREPAQRNPVLVVSRHRNAFWFAGYSPDTTVSQAFRLAHGAPILTGTEARMTGGRSTYPMPKAWRRECRVFVIQEAETTVACAEQCSGMVGVTRRLSLRGLRGATVRFFPEPGSEGRVAILRDPRPPYLVGDFAKPSRENTPDGPCLAVERVTGDLLISW
jgi:hypothetical protein